MNARRAALRIFSGKIIYNRAMPGGLRTARHCVFTGGVVTANGICGAAFCESAAQREAGLPAQALPEGKPLAKPESLTYCQGHTSFYDRIMNL